MNQSTDGAVGSSALQQHADRLLPRIQTSPRLFKYESLVSLEWLISVASRPRRAPRRLRRCSAACRWSGRARLLLTSC